MAGHHLKLTRSVNRAFQLYDETCRRGAKWMIDGDERGPRAPDKRDIAEMLFFEVAAQWEAFSTAAFEEEVKQRYRVKRITARHIMGHIDNESVRGYGSPKRLVDRAQAMLSESSPLVTFQANVPQAYDRLFHSYRIRNYLAHTGMGGGRDGFLDVLNALNVPVAQRRWMSVGRLLLDHRIGGVPLFYVLLRNYVAVADYVLSRTR